MADAPQDNRLRRYALAAVPLVIFLALAGVFFKQLMAGGDSHDIPSALIGKAMAPFSLAPLAGLKGPKGVVPGLTSNMLKGRVSIVNVWASWCAPCRIEHPVLMQLAKDTRFMLAGINYKDSSENALRFLGQLGNPFAAAGVDPKGKAAIDWGVYGVPETFIISADGTIVYKHVGPLTPESLNNSLLPALEAALGKAAGG